MPTYLAQTIHGRTGGEGRYEFEGPDGLMARSPVKVMRYFMENATKPGFVEHEDYEVFSALKNDEGDVVTILGEFIYAPGNRSPFIAMISHE